MAVLAGGLRELLLGRGERVDGLVLRAFVPVSLHGAQAGPARGNLDGAMVVPLPVGEAGDARRLRLIAAETAERKQKQRPLVARCSATSRSSGPRCGWRTASGS